MQHATRYFTSEFLRRSPRIPFHFNSLQQAAVLGKLLVILAIWSLLVGKNIRLSLIERTSTSYSSHSI